MKIPVYKVKGQLATFYIFGKEKMIEIMLDDGLPVNLVDSKIENLSEMTIEVLKTLEIEQMVYEIGEVVHDSANHELAVVTVDAHGQYICADLVNNCIKYYYERDLFRIHTKTIGDTEFTREYFATSAARIDDIIDKFDQVEEKTEGERMMEFFFKRNHE